MKIDSRITKIFLLTLISMLTLGVGYVHTRAAEEVKEKYTGTYSTSYVRVLWAYCYNAALRRRIHPTAASVHCDCIVDAIRVRHTKQVLDNMTNREETFVKYANECGKKLFGPAPTSLPGEVTHAEKLPIGIKRWSDAMFISHNNTKLILPRVRGGGT